MARFRIVPERSRLWAEARSSVHPIRVETTGLEGFFEAEIAHDRPDLTVAPLGRIEIDAERLKTGNGLYDHELERRLEMRKYPRIRGQIKEVKDVGGGRYRVRGDLSFHGVTHCVEGEVSLRPNADGTIEIEGTQTLDMRDFKLEPPRLLMLKVHPEVKVRGVVVVEREH